MPNYCECELTVTGPLEEVNRFIKYAESNKLSPEQEDNLLDFNRFIPYPDNFRNQDDMSYLQDKLRKEMAEGYIGHGMNKKEAEDKAFAAFPGIKDGYNQGGHDWCVENWGTKWNACVVNRDIDKRSITLTKCGVRYNFDTAWSPPTPIVKKMGEIFTTLKFTLKYWEHGAAFKGEFIADEGVVQKDVSSNYNGQRGG